MCETTSKFVCVHCGYFLNQLYKQYGPNVLKLVNCPACGNVADKYIEYDNIIILIDLILLNKQAYRHVLLNMNLANKNYWRLAAFLLIVKSCNDWLSFKNQAIKHDYALPDELFFFSFAVSILSDISLYWFVVTFTTWFLLKPHHQLKGGSKLCLWKSHVASSFGWFLIMSSLVWDEYTRNTHYLIVVYVFLSNIQALSVVSEPNINKWMLAVIVIAAMLGQQSVQWFLHTYFRLLLESYEILPVTSQSF